jgi:hypothetical protein
MAEKVQDKKTQKWPEGKSGGGAGGSGAGHQPKHGDKGGHRPESSPKKGDDSKKKW